MGNNFAGLNSTQYKLILNIVFIIVVIIICVNIIEGDLLLLLSFIVIFVAIPLNNMFKITLLNDNGLIFCKSLLNKNQKFLLSEMKQFKIIKLFVIPIGITVILKNNEQIFISFSYRNLKIIKNM